MLKSGFYTALGTPLDENGRLVESALRKHIENQIEAGASGLLLMGSMGIEASIREEEYKKIVDTAISAVKGRLPLFVGAMDNSIERVMDKINAIGEGREIEGIVLTVPFYFKSSDADAVYWFKSIADRSPYPIYLYDLPSVTQYKVTVSVIGELITHKNIKGIKTADWELIHAIGRKYKESGFECLYSGLDAFDYANVMGITKNLDGMFCCMPNNAKKLYSAINAGDFKSARVYLDNILLLRDTMIKNGLMRCFTVCMNLLGFEGNFHPDYCAPITKEAKALMAEMMHSLGEI